MPRPAPGTPAPKSDRNGPPRDRTKPRAVDGTYVLTVEGIKDLGWKHQRPIEGRERSDAPMLQVRVVGVDSEGTPFTVFREMTMSYDSRSVLTAMAAAILGIDPNDDEAEFDWRQLVRGRFLGEIKSRKYHPRLDDREDESVWHYWTEWKGKPMAIPAALQAALPAVAAAPARGAATPQPSAPAASGAPAAPTQRGGAIAPAGPPNPATELMFAQAEITREVWDSVGPVLRRVLDDDFSGEAGQMCEYFRQEAARDGSDPLKRHAAHISGFLVPKPDGSAAFNFRGRTNPDAEDLRDALLAYEAEWKRQDEAAGQTVDSDELPL